MEKLSEDIYAHLSPKSSLSRNPGGKDPRAGQRQPSLLCYFSQERIHHFHSNKLWWNAKVLHELISYLSLKQQL